MIAPLAGTASVVSVQMNRANRSPPLCQLLLVGLHSIRRAAIVTDAGYTNPDRAPLDTLTESSDRFTLPPPSTPLSSS
jgi:hypothetical protein